MGEQRYLDRAKSWVQADLDVTLEALGVLVSKFTAQLRFDTGLSEVVRQDLQDTLYYLKAECEIRLAKDPTSDPTAPAADEISDTALEGFLDEAVFDSSPLVPDVPIQPKSSVEREEALNELINLGLVHRGTGRH